MMQKIEREDLIDSALVRRLFVYWRSKCRDGKIPRRADIDPAEIPALTPNILIVDIEQDPFRVRYRLVGTKIVEATGFEFTGKYLDEIILPDDEGPFLESYRAACELKSPILSRIKWRLEDDTTGEYDACFMPLSDDGETVNKVISLECYQSIERDFDFFGSRSFRRTQRRRN